MHNSVTGLLTDHLWARWLVSQRGTLTIPKRLRDLAGTAKAAGIKDEDDVQSLVDEVRYGKGRKE